MKAHHLGVCSAIIAAIFTTGSWSATVDFGVKGSAALADEDIPTSPPSGTQGVFGPAVYWPIIPLHLVLLPDGTTMSYGTNMNGAQKGMLIEHWNPKLGTVASAHTVSPNGVKTDFFCSGHTVISKTGETLITGGDKTIDHVRNYSNADTNFYNYLDGTVRPGAKMAFKRWYPTLVTMADGKVVTLGGRSGINPSTFANTPEIWTPGEPAFKALYGATNATAYGGGPGQAWFYPRCSAAPNGLLFCLTHKGAAYWMGPGGPNGNGFSVKIGGLVAPEGDASLPSLTYAPGKILSARNGGKVVTIDLNGMTPVMKEVAPLSQARYWANATVLADGKVLVSGGAVGINKLQGVANHIEIWNPLTGQWIIGASAKKPRLYHSTALLLPDATVLTGGGGAPGPVDNLNAEIYYPPYLYLRDGTGNPAPRPTITNAPNVITWGGAAKAFFVSYTSTRPISRVTFVRTGAATHSFNSDQRLIDLNIQQRVNAGTLLVDSPKWSVNAPPGFYMMFIIDNYGTPSRAKIIRM